MTKSNNIITSTQESIVFPADEIKTGVLYKIDVPSIIDTVAVSEIQSYLATKHSIGAGCYPDIEWTWKTTRGTLPKRIASSIYKTVGIKLTTADISHIGNIASNSNKEQTFYFNLWKIKDSLMWTDGTFGDEGSCYWSSRESMFSLFENHHFWAMKLYRPSLALSFEELCEHMKEDELYIEKYHTGLCKGRCWVKKKKFPQLNNSYGYIFFNGYGLNNGAVDFARMFSQRFGNMSYRKIGLCNQDSDEGLMYINSGSGFLVAPVSYDEISKITEIDFNIDQSKYGWDLDTCAICGDEISETHIVINREGYDALVCTGCYDYSCTFCARCENTFISENDFQEVGGEYWCAGCVNEDAIYCDGEDIYVSSDTCTVEVDGLTYTQEYADDHFTYCPNCDKYIST